MKLSTLLIKVQVDFEYGRNKGLVYVSTLFSFATFMEVVKVNRKWYFVVIPTAIILTWLWGIFLRKINYRKRETEFINNENPMITKIYKNVSQTTENTEKR